MGDLIQLIDSKINRISSKLSDMGFKIHKEGEVVLVAMDGIGTLAILTPRPDRIFMSVALDALPTEIADIAVTVASMSAVRIGEPFFTNGDNITFFGTEAFDAYEQWTMIHE